MTMLVSIWIVLCGFREIRYGRALSITGPAGKNITTGMAVTLECQSDQYGIVFEFTHRSSTLSVPIAECEFKTNTSSTAFFMPGGFELAYNISQIYRTCILTILSLINDQCGTYSCSELYVKSEYVYWNISCNGTTHVSPDLTDVQPDTGRTWTRIGSILGVVGFIALVVCSLAYRKWRNTIHIPETDVSTHERETFISQLTIQEESHNATVFPETIDVEYTEHEMIDERTNSSIEMEEAQHNSEEPDTENGPASGTIEESAIGHIIYERIKANLPNARTVGGLVWGATNI